MVSARNKACFESSAGNQLEVKISLFYIALTICGVSTQLAFVQDFLCVETRISNDTAFTRAHVQLSIHGGDRPLLIVGLGLN